ncbi:hypothetical protein FHG87_005510 [Trinorchestia longiramus]|nr:hypothetical protein FHG87_005510 [Trinorchestia longiramus]
MLAVQQFLLATSLLCSATGCGDEAKKSSGLSMSVTADNSQRLTLVSHENKFDRINSFNGGHEQMMGENDTDELQTNVNNCSNALVANEYLNNTGFDPKTTSDRSHTEISNTNSVLKNMQRTLENEKSGNSSKETRTESLEGHVFKSVEGIQFPKQPVMLSLSPDSNESYVSYPLEPDLPSPDIVPLEDLRTDVEEAPRNRSLPGDPKRPYFPIEKAPVGNENAVDSNRSSGLLDNDWTPLRCITCSSTTDHTHCYNLPHPNQTDNFDDEDLSQECLYRHETYCLASHVWYVDKTEENKPYHHFSIERRCATDCKPYYIVMGDKTKMEIIINRTCCMTDNCNRRNTAEGTPLKSQHIYKVSFAVLIVFKLMLHF